MNEGYTDWAVLTGGACSGKSTLANYFLADGQEVIPESANQYVEFGNSKGCLQTNFRAMVQEGLYRT